MGAGKGKAKRITVQDEDDTRRQSLRIKLPSEKRGFRFVRDRGLILICPAKGEKMRWSDWEPQEYKFRSLVVREETGEVVSAGFSKFGNYGEAPDESETLNRALADDEHVWFTDKVDGSLCARSVVDGEVLMRSRAALNPENEHIQAMEKVAAERYPILLDPKFEPDRSLLFEFVSPNFRIVLPYPEDDLIFIGAVSHKDLSYASLPELEKVAVENNLNIVEHVELPTDPEALVAAVHKLAGREGVVARCDNDQTLVKLKGADYLARHRLKFALTARGVREICISRNVRSLDDFEEFLKEQKADWELVEDAKPLVETYVKGIARAEQKFIELKNEVITKQKEFPERKDFAVNYATKLPGSLRGAAFAVLSGSEDRAFTIVRNETLDKVFAEAEAADEKLLSSE